MDLRTGTSSLAGTGRLRTVPDDSSQGTVEDPLLAAIEAADGAVDLRVDLTLLRDAATVLTARRRLEGLLLQLAVDPFDPAAYRGLRCYLAGTGAQVLAAHERLTAASARGL